MSQSKLKERREIDAIATEFERAIKRGEKPTIEEFLRRCRPSIREECFQELLYLELHYAGELGIIPATTLYAERFAEFPDSIAAVFDEVASECSPGMNESTGLSTARERNDRTGVWPRLPSKFVIIAELGRGGCGVVYKVKDTVLGVTRAVKVARPSLHATGQAVLLAEARKGASLKHHPNIIHVHEADHTHDGQIYLVMDHVEGCRSLAEHLQSTGPLPVMQSVKIGLSLADALGHAHDAGLVHRDLKPDNILIDADGSPRVTDFGLAVWSSERADLQGGTASYMAPEQLVGTPYYDNQTDIWAVGVILHEMLTGELPFEGESETQLSDRIIHRPSPSIRQNFPQRHVPEDLDRICRKCLEQDRSRRYLATRDLRNDLTNVEIWLRRLPAAKRTAAGKHVQSPRAHRSPAGKDTKKLPASLKINSPMGVAASAAHKLPAEIVTVFDAILGGSSGKQGALDEREAFAALLLIAIASDGRIAKEEMCVFDAMVNRMQLYRTRTAQEFSSMVNKLLRLLKEEGPDALIQKAVSSLPEGMRETAFASMVDLVFADGVVVDEEKALLENLHKRLGVPTEEAMNILRVLMLKNKG